jgi:hypothetical protein
MRILTAVAATVLLVSPALAQNASSQAQQTNPAQGLQNTIAPQQQGPTAEIAQQIRSNLENAGFKDIKLMPSSFLVRALDQNDNPVMMVINPDSVTELHPRDNTTTGQGTGGQPNQPSSGTIDRPNQQQ